MFSIDTCFMILIVFTIIAIVGILLTKARKETYLQQEWKELSNYSIKEWLNQSYKLCIPRIKAECPTKGDFSCVAKSLHDCQQANKTNLNQLCLQEATKKLCNNSANKDKCNTNLSYFHQIGQLCVPPDLS